MVYYVHVHVGVAMTLDKHTILYVRCLTIAYILIPSTPHPTYSSLASHIIQLFISYSTPLMESWVGGTWNGASYAANIDFL